AGPEAESLLEIEAIDLVDNAVDVVAETGPALLDLPIDRKHFRNTAGEPHQRIDRKAPRAQSLLEAPLSVGRQTIDFAPAIGEEAQGAFRGHRRIELSDEAGSRVTRVGEDLEALLCLGGVEPLEIGVAHIDLAARLEGGRKILGGDDLRDVADGPHIRGHVLALIAVAARRALDQLASLIAQRDRESVDLRFGRD